MRFEFGWVLACFRQRCRILIVSILAGLSCFSTGATASENHALWDALRSGGTVALLRHALAPGTGDPAAFALGDCSTQRNLSEAGRVQARRIGALFGRTASMTQSYFQASGAGAWKQHNSSILAGSGNCRRSTLSSVAMSVKKRKSWQSRHGSAARN